MRRFTVMTIVGAIVLSTGVAGAAEFTVSQKKKSFDPKTVNAKLGDTVLFVNDDRYAHNLFSKTPKFKFNVRKQMPGSKYSMKLNKRGTFEVLCVIHPRMKMTINVK